MGIVGCSMLKKHAPDAGDGAAEASASAEVEAAPAPLAANEADVTRYPQEKPETETGTIEEAMATLHTEIGAKGLLVGVLKKGAVVEKIAEHEGYSLVVADDPKDPSRKIMGWTGNHAFVLLHKHDAGVLGDGGAFADAGAGPAHGDGGQPAGDIVCVKQGDGGTCPTGFAVSGSVCRTSCSTPAECNGPEPKCKGGKCYNKNGCR
jgi:hypothetical protein